MKIKIEGMSCSHCEMAVENALSKISGIKSYNVDLKKGEANIIGNPDQKIVIEAINKLGYKATLVE
jgi:copper chaperone